MVSDQDVIGLLFRSCKLSQQSFFSSRDWSGAPEPEAKDDQRFPAGRSPLPGWKNMFDGLARSPILTVLHHVTDWYYTGAFLGFWLFAKPSCFTNWKYLFFLPPLLAACKPSWAVCFWSRGLPNVKKCYALGTFGSQFLNIGKAWIRQSAINNHSKCLAEAQTSLALTG